MSLTGNFEAAFEVREAVVRDIFVEAYKSGEIPHELNINDTIAGHALTGFVKIAQSNVEASLTLSFATPVPNGIELTVPLDIEVQVVNSPAPSINPIKFSAGLEITAPVQALADAAGNKELVLNLAGLPDGQVVVVMPGAEVIPVNAALIEDGLHKAYADGKIPHTVTYLGTQIDVDDDDADPTRQIKFIVDTPISPGPGEGTLSLPIFIHYGPGLEETVKVHHIKVKRDGNDLIIRFADVTAADVETSPLLAGHKAVIAQMVQSYNEYKVFVPGNAAIAGIIRAAAKSKLATWGADGNGRIHIYTPNAVENAPIEILDFVPKVKPGFLAVLFNPMAGANADDVDNFIPAGKKFAQALAEPVIQRMVEQALKEKILDENGCGGWPCKFDHEIEGHEVTLTSKPTFSLKAGYMQMNGSAEVAVDCWFDPDVDYEAKVKFHFETDGDNKVIKPDIFDEDVDLSCMDWFLGFIIPIYGWIALGVVNSVIDSVGGSVVHEEGDKIAKGTKYLAGEIHGVGGVTTLLDQIDVQPQGMILSGGTFVVSSTQALTYVPSNSGAPYFGQAASLIAVNAVNLHPSAKYQWAMGDGHAANGAQIKHRYVEDGIYLAELTTAVDLPRGLTSRHYARIQVANVQPVVRAGADIVANEGEVINFLGQFTDVEWLDKHEAVWLWGDKTMGKGAVVETNQEPQAEGKVTGQHAYCDNGEYTVVLRVRDDDGGVGRSSVKVKVLNVPPTVEAGDDLFAYACAPITLQACFLDPGWCDTHTGWWDFGDCSAPMPAIIREKHQPPAGIGLAAAAHMYKCCGTFQARCTVIDDDGGVGEDTLLVRVVDVLNRDFEGGFRNRLAGVVANEWEPYVAGAGGKVFAGDAVGTGKDGATLFGAEEFVVHGGQRSQRINGLLESRAGIYQRLGTNLGWDYQISAWYHLDERTGGLCRLGIDPAGGTDPASPNVEWSDGEEHRNWAQLVGRITAKARALTIFLELAAGDRGAIGYFDDVTLIPYPCPLKECLPPPAPKVEERCVDWAGEKKARSLGVEYARNGFVFRSLTHEPLRLANRGVPANQNNLALPARGIYVQTPFAADRVTAQVLVSAREPIRLEAFDSRNQRVGEAASSSEQNQPQVLEVKASDITAVVLKGGGNEGLLLRLCANRQASGGGPVTPDQYAALSDHHHADMGAGDPAAPNK